MNPHADYATLFNLPRDERLQLAEELWESVAAEQEREPLPEAALNELRERVAKYEANPEDVIPWDEVKRRLRNG
ncbi:addiction module protein [Piscinibacter sp.]|uniref:addiction module protein n=1 Tax=Piscinibacter sp. TaxID=1903157 RepID=UPI002CFD6598|nr:addiction module protein [Albitalea sp.]HUG24069.1 addiction module protein [Albitalea sp.]